MIKVLVPVDTIEYDYTLNAVREAVELAKSDDRETKLTFLHVAHVEADRPKPERKRLVREREEKMEEEFSIIMEECRKKSVRNAKTLVREGRAPEEIVKVAKEGGFDLIVMGSGKIHDPSVKGKIKRFLYGSTTEAVIHETPCSILISKPTEDV